MKAFKSRDSVIAWTDDLGLTMEEAYQMALMVAQTNYDEEEYNDIYEEYTTYLIEKELFSDDEEVLKASKIQREQEA